MLRRGTSRMDAARGVMGQGWPMYAGPRSSTGVREVSRSETRMSGCPSLAHLSWASKKGVAPVRGATQTFSTRDNGPCQATCQTTRKLASPVSTGTPNIPQRSIKKPGKNPVSRTRPRPGKQPVSEVHAVVQRVRLDTIVGLFQASVGVVNRTNADFLTGETQACADTVLELE